MQSTETCSGNDCARRVYCKMMCKVHYERHRRHVRGQVPRLVSVEEYISTRTDDAPPPVGRPSLGRCVVWTGMINADGYGAASHRHYGRKKHLAHRFVLMVEGKDLTEGMVVDHLCRNRACVNLSHLELVSNAENLKRGLGYRLRNGMDSKCLHGHEFTEENTYTNPNTGRLHCKTCRRATDRIRKGLNRREA